VRSLSRFGIDGVERVIGKEWSGVERSGVEKIRE